MTIQEARSKYGVKSYITNQGDTLTQIVDKVYNDRTSIYYYIITELNSSIDWCPVVSGEATGMASGIEVFYLPKSICTQIYEVTG